MQKLRYSKIRFIPARAGNIIQSRRRGKAGAVHPRSCGEHMRAMRWRIRCIGSSPLVRGTSGGPERAEKLCRFIPARAGNMHSPDRQRRYTAVHPRSCGEHPARFLFSNDQTGSSPLVRGTLYSGIKHAIKYRFIPARAGNMRLGTV